MTALEILSKIEKTGTCIDIDCIAIQSTKKQSVDCPIYSRYTHCACSRDALKTRASLVKEELGKEI